MLKVYEECFPAKGRAFWVKLREILAALNATLAGGTALALQIGHRHSDDLDFFTADKFVPDAIIEAIRNRGCKVEVINSGENHFVAFIDKVKVSVFNYAYNFCRKAEQYEGVEIANVQEIAAMKVIALSQRGLKKDFVDIYFLCNRMGEKNMDFIGIAGQMVKMFGVERLNPVHIGKSMVYFKDADAEPDPVFTYGNAVKWADVKKYFQKNAVFFTRMLSDAMSRSAVHSVTGLKGPCL